MVTNAECDSGINVRKRPEKEERIFSGSITYPKEKYPERKEAMEGVLEIIKDKYPSDIKQAEIQTAGEKCGPVLFYFLEDFDTALEATKTALKESMERTLFRKAKQTRLTEKD